MGAVDYTLEVAFNESVAGVFTLESALDGPDVLSDVGLYAASYDKVSDDAQAPYEVAVGTDNLIGQIQAASLTATVARVDDPSYWNPNNPDSPLNAAAPGFTPMRPVRLTAKGRNRLANSDAAVGLTGWTSVVGRSAVVNDFSRSTAWTDILPTAIHYKWTLGHLVPPANCGIQSPTGISGVPVVAGDDWTLSCSVKTVDPSFGSGGYLLTAAWYDAAGTLLGTDSAAFDDNGLNGDRLVATFTAPADAAFLAVSVLTHISASGDTSEFYVTAIQLEHGSVATEYSVSGDTRLFTGFIRQATWDAVTRLCELYCEDLLLWASRVRPVIASTGPTNVGAVVTRLFAAVDPTVTPIVDHGTYIDDFSADGTQSVTDLLTELLAVDLGTVYINGDGTPVYVQHDTPLAADAAATITITEQASSEQSGISLDQIGTRATVEKTDAAGNILATWTSNTSSDAFKIGERRSGRADIAAISSPYVNDGQALADELVAVGVQGKQPLEFTLADVDVATLRVILAAAPLTVYTLVDDFGGNSGDAIAQRIVHTIGTGIHQADVVAIPRPSRAFRLDSALDGPDTLRYP